MTEKEDFKAAEAWWDSTGLSHFDYLGDSLREIWAAALKYERERVQQSTHKNESVSETTDPKKG